MSGSYETLSFEHDWGLGWAEIALLTIGNKDLTDSEIKMIVFGLSWILNDILEIGIPFKRASDIFYLEQRTDIFLNANDII